MERRFFTAFFGGEERSRNLLRLLAAVSILDLLLLETDSVRCGADSNVKDDVGLPLLESTRSRASTGIGGKGLFRCSLPADLVDTSSSL